MRVSYFPQPLIEGINKDGSDIEKNFLGEGGKGSESRLEGVGAGDWEAADFPSLPHSQNGICRGQSAGWMAWRQWAGRDDLKRAWPMSWNLGFCDLQRYGYRWERERQRGRRQSLESMHCMEGEGGGG